ncbi:adenosine 5'-monophosphoramidase HINT3-like isoform X1 [Amphiura filiformis]|uniref:adenosine 5'-monophosphoramidase HINT3-like isoform X1 n=1 Tax=Amphiura filiformis TaxID=82378 RepID=UPI003B21ED86
MTVTDVLSHFSVASMCPWCHDSPERQQLRKEFESDIVNHGEEPQVDEHCIFCQIIQGHAPDQPIILFQNSEVSVFFAKHSSSFTHLLIVPTCHHGNPQLKKEDLPVVEYLHKVGMRVLEMYLEYFMWLNKWKMENCTVRSGFHSPSYKSAQHLHLHVIFTPPGHEMEFMDRLQYKHNSSWFVTYDRMINRLKNMPDADALPPPKTENQGQATQKKIAGIDTPNFKQKLQLALWASRDYFLPTQKGN